LTTYTRASKFASTLDDSYSLDIHHQKETAVGIFENRFILNKIGEARVEEGVDPSTEIRTDLFDHNKLTDVINIARAKAGTHSKSSWGTRLHKQTEALDKGEQPFDDPVAQPDLDAYEWETQLLEFDQIERFCVNDEVQAAGTPDRTTKVVDDQTGRLWIVDLKGLALTTPIPTPEGWTTMGDVQVGDTVFDAYGEPCMVTKKSEVKRIGTYVVKFDDGSQVVCDQEHIWWTTTGRGYNDKTTAKPIQEIIDTFHDGTGRRQHRVPVAGALSLPEADLSIDPYLLGCWLGDGASRGGTITKERALFEILESDGNDLGIEQMDSRKPHVITRTVLGLTSQLRELDLLHNKHIPPGYLRASLGQRLRLLQGLMDTDGTWNTARREADFTTTDKGLALAVEELVSSLGQRAYLCSNLAKGFGLEVLCYHVRFTPVDINPFRLPRKRDQASASTKPTTRAQRRVMLSIEEGPDVETACIAVDSPSRTYLCGERMIPTHNTGSIDHHHKWALQLAVYAHSLWYDHNHEITVDEKGKPTEVGCKENLEAHTRTPIGVQLDRGIIIHLPRMEGKCDLYEIDLKAGWEAVQEAVWVRNWRKRKDLLKPFNPDNFSCPF